jgi:hypothetical protein
VALPGLPEVEETGVTFEDNARLKALAASPHYGGWVLADDSGLEVDALGGEPGVRSARFAGDAADMEENRALLLQRMQGLADRAARFRCVLALAREAYHKTQWNARDMADALSFPGLWKFLFRHPRMAWEEGARSLSRKLFCHSLQRLVPDLREEDLSPGGAGVRAQAISPGGELVQDFRLVPGPRVLHVLNAPSPAATASLAIGRHIAAQISG